MLLMVLALAAAQTPAAAQAPAVELTPQQEEEIVVLGRRLATWRGDARFTKGRYECKTKRSSGNPAIDRLACSAMTQCMAQVQPTVDKLLASRPSRKERERLLQPVGLEMKRCSKAAHDEGLRQLALQEEVSTVR